MATDAIISFAIERLGDLIIQEAKFLFGVRDQVMSLQDELQRMRCFLKDAESKQYESERVRHWISEIREAAYDAEDLLEDFVLKNGLKKQGGIKGVLKRLACLPCEGVSLHKIGSDVEGITTRLSRIATGMRDFGIQEAMGNEQLDSLHARQREKRESFPHAVEHDLVGLESNTEELVSALVDEEKKFRIISICGMGGLGKTTLARQVYNHNKVRNHFDSFAWAYIFKQCKRRDIWEGILLSLSNKHDVDQIRKWRDQKLVEELHNFLQNSKSLVVLDDLWSSEAWDSLKDAFPYESKSRIILTSRNKDVALYADLQGLLHQPKCLNDDQSWELLQKIVFPKRNNNTEFKIEKQMEALGKQMIEHCAGLPLAIRVLGGLLAKKCTTTQWQKIHENVKSYITGDVGQTSDNSSVDGVLSLSYEELPSQLKKCFLYLAQFPEDYEIPVDKLLKFWSAEEMIAVKSQGERRMVEDVAICYLDELIERSMVLVGARDVVSSRLRTCRLHDLMRDLCLLKSEQENFARVIDPQIHDVQADSMPSLSTSNFRRVAVHVEYGGRFLQKNIRNDRLRSLIYFNRMVKDSSMFKRNWKLLEPNFRDFIFLRVLDLEGADLKEGKVPEDIGKLIHLRFLSFRNAKVSSFPSSMGNLRLMETLDLRVLNAYVPDVLWKMEKLRHLYLPLICKGQKRLTLRTLLELRTLVFPLGVCDVNDLFSLTKLHTLTIRWTSRRGKIEAPMLPVSLSASLGQLESLSLGGPILGVTESYLPFFPPAADVSLLLSGFTRLLDLNLDLKITRLPNLDMIPSSIRSITLGWCQLEEDPMPVLEGLPELRSLVLYLKACTEKVMICTKTGFPKLSSLSIGQLGNLEEWKLEEGGMPCLSILEIDACRNLKKLPEALKGIDTLQKIQICWMPKSFKDELVPGGCDFYKIQHVSSVVFRYCDGD